MCLFCGYSPITNETKGEKKKQYFIHDIKASQDIILYRQLSRCFFPTANEKGLENKTQNVLNASAVNCYIVLKNHLMVLIHRKEYISSVFFLWFSIFFSIV